MTTKQKTSNAQTIPTRDYFPKHVHRGDFRDVGFLFDDELRNVEDIFGRRRRITRRWVMKVLQQQVQISVGNNQSHRRGGGSGRWVGGFRRFAHFEREEVLKRAVLLIFCCVICTLGDDNDSI